MQTRCWSCTLAVGRWWTGRNGSRNSYRRANTKNCFDKSTASSLNEKDWKVHSMWETTTESFGKSPPLPWGPRVAFLKKNEHTTWKEDEKNVYCCNARLSASPRNKGWIKGVYTMRRFPWRHCRKFRWLRTRTEKRSSGATTKWTTGKEKRASGKKGYFQAHKETQTEKMINYTWKK